MSVSTSPASARTDAASGRTHHHSRTGTRTNASRATRPVPGAGTRTARRVGAAVTAGAGIWAAGIALVGQNPTDSLAITLSDLSALPFQLGLFALVALQLRTRATGTSKVAVGMLHVERVLLALATSWTVLHGAVPAFRDDLWLAILDVFWPLSMLGMAIIGIKVAIAGRWKGLARFWPLVAESWAFVVIPFYGALGPIRAVDGLAAGHLLIGYCALGLVIALRPHLTGARD